MKLSSCRIALLIAFSLTSSTAAAQNDSARSRATESRQATDSQALVITTASGTPLEERGRAQLLRLIETYDIERWLFTRRMQIQSRVIPHSHPILTLNTQYVRNDTAQLATLLHEQFHWYVGQRPDADVDALKAELRRRYPVVPERGPEGARDRESTYLHLIVCTLEYEAMAALLGRDVARRTLEGWTHYTWVYRTILADNAELVALMNRHGVGIGERPAR
jgi:hypothetical protein